MNKLKNYFIGIYYKIKYVIKTSNGPVGIIYTNDKKKKEFENKLDKIAREIKPCSKTIEEVEQYIIDKYNAGKNDISETRLKCLK